MFADQPDRLRGNAQGAGVIARVQKHLEERARVFFEHVLAAGGNVAVAQFESLVDGHDVHLALGLEHGLIEGQHQHFIELRQGQGPAVVELHELLYGELVAIDKTPDRRQFTLVIEQQAVFFAARDHVQRVANAPEKLLAVHDGGGFGLGQKAVFREFPQLAPAEMAARQPADELQVAQPPGGAFDIGFEAVFRIRVLRVTLFLLLELGAEKILRRPHLPRVDARVHRRDEFAVAQEQPRLDQAGQHGDIARGLGHAFGHAANAVADLQTQIPEQGQKTLQATGVARVGAALQNQQIDVRVGVQLAAAVTAHGHERQIARRQAQFPPRMAQHVVDQRGALAQQFSGVASSAKIPIQIRPSLAQGVAQRGQQVVRRIGVQGIGIEASRVRVHRRIHGRIDRH